jgi:hypothetical protein
MQLCVTTIRQRNVPIRAPIGNANGYGTRIKSKGMGMIDLQDRIANERKEIAKRIASFRATQEKFKREREDYCVTTLENARQENLHHGNTRPPFWS